MGKSFKELKDKVTEQMRAQVSEIKTVTVEQWAKENGFVDVYFNDYEEAKKWVDENVNSNPKLKKDFYNFESEVDENINGIVGELENGSSSALTQKAREIGKKYVSPAVKTLATAVAINFGVTQAVGLGLTQAGAAAHAWATNAVNGIDISSGIAIDSNWGLLNGAKEAVVGAVQSGVESVETGVKGKLTNAVNGINDVYNKTVVPVAKKATTVVLGFFQAKGIIKDAKGNLERNELEDENKKQQNQIDALKSKLSDVVDDPENLVAKKRVSALKNIGSVQQMKYTISQMKELFQSEGVAIPDVPENCISMEEYGKFLRKSLENQKVSKEKTDMVYTTLDLYKYNIKKMTTDLRMGKTNVFNRTKEAIKNGVDNIKNGSLELGAHAKYSIKGIAKNAISKGVTKEDIDRAKMVENRAKGLDVEPALG